MSNTIIIGDVAEGQVWFGVAEFLKQELVNIYKTTNQNMVTWKQVTADVKIFVKMVNGHPQAFIFVDSILGGFVLGLQNSALLPVEPVELSKWKFAALLKNNLKTGVWSVKKQPYEISNKPTPSALPYSITPNNEVIFTFKGEIYKALKSFVPAEKTPSGYFSGEPLYLDDNTVFLNQGKTIVPVINSLVDPIGWATRDDLKFEWTDDVIVADLTLGMLVLAWRYDSPPIVRRVGDELKYYFLMMNETIVGTVQRFQLTVKASLLAPYLIKESLTTEVQEWQLGDYYPTRGFISTQGPGSAAPSGGMDPRGLLKWNKSGDGPDDGWNITGFVGTGVYASGQDYISTYAASNSNESTITLDSGLEFKVMRTMSSKAVFSYGSTLFYGTNDTGQTIWMGNITEDRAHGYIPQKALNPDGTAPGAGIGNAGAAESGQRLSNSDSASTGITCLQLPADIQKTTHSSTRSGAKVVSVEYTKGYSDPSTDVNYGGESWMTLYTFAPTISTNVTNNAFRNHTFNTTVESRDYIYCDLDEQVFMYIELVATGTYTNFVGSSEGVFRFCLNYRGLEYKQDIYSFTQNSSIFVRQTLPNDVNFGTGPIEIYFTIPNPYMPKLIFTPTWTTQNQCPHIAYRTLSEIGSIGKDGNPIPDELLLSMRFQLTRERRYLDDSEFFPTEAKEPPEGTVILIIPNIEHTCRFNGFQVKGLFTKLEMLWPTVTFSVPQSPDWLANVLPETWPRPPSQDEEPVDGTFYKNSGDLSTWHIYRT